MGVYTTAFTEELMEEHNDLTAKCSQMHRNQIILAEEVAWLYDGSYEHDLGRAMMNAFQADKQRDLAALRPAYWQR